MLRDGSLFSECARTACSADASHDVGVLGRRIESKLYVVVTRPVRGEPQPSGRGENREGVALGLERRHEEPGHGCGDLAKESVVLLLRLCRSGTAALNHLARGGHSALQALPDDRNLHATIVARSRTPTVSPAASK